ncbi:MAG: hypothetical protein AAF907_06885, partial [Planctomycetota bacterium]
RWEMTTAGARLRGGEERYNPAILAAMERFVNGVDGEIRAEAATLRAAAQPATAAGAGSGE